MIGTFGRLMLPLPIGVSGTQSLGAMTITRIDQSAINTAAAELKEPQ